MSDNDQPNIVAEPTIVQALQALVERARAGDQSSLPELQRAMDEHPELWEHFAALSGHAEGAWIGLLSNADLCMRESLLRRAAAMRAELKGEAPSPLENLLVDAVFVTWFEAEYFAVVLANSHDGGTLRQAESLQHRRDAAHKRHLAAIRTLAEVRKLLRTSAPKRASLEAKRQGGSRTQGPTGSKTVGYAETQGPSTIPMNRKEA